MPAPNDPYFVAPVPPHSVDAEQALLGAIFVSPEAMDDVAELLPASEMFYRTAHRNVWEAMQAIRSAGTELDAVTVTAELVRRGELDAAGGRDYVNELACKMMLSYGAPDYANQIRQHYIRRQIIQASNDLLKDAYDPTVTPSESLAQAATIIRALDADDGSLVPEPAAILGAIRARMAQAVETGQIAGWRTGHLAIDADTLGYFKGEVSLLCGRTGDGKSYTAWTLAAGFQRANKLPAGIVQLEMEPDDLVDRQVVQDLFWQSVANPEVPPSEIQRLKAEADVRLAMYAESPILVAAPKRSRMEDVEQSIRALVRRGCRFVVIDYIGLIAAPARLSPIEVAEHHIHALKACARANAICILALSQVNRENMKGSIMDFGLHHAYGHAGAHVGNAAHRVSVTIPVFKHGQTDPKVIRFVKLMGEKHDLEGWARHLTLQKFVKGRRGESTHWKAWKPGDGIGLDPVEGVDAVVVSECAWEAMRIKSSGEWTNE